MLKNGRLLGLGAVLVALMVAFGGLSSSTAAEAATTVKYTLPFHPNNGSYAAASDINQWYSSWHPAYDFALDEGEAVFAAASGNVSVGYQDDGYGYYIKIQHSDGCVTDYAHLSKRLVSQGQVVAGQKIGLAGKTGAASGPHLHFQVNCKDSSSKWQAINPGNPTLSGGCGRWLTCPATPSATNGKDVNADGKDDVVGVYDYGGEIGIWAFKSTGKGFTASKWYTSGGWTLSRSLFL